MDLRIHSRPANYRFMNDRYAARSRNDVVD